MSIILLDSDHVFLTDVDDVDAESPVCTDDCPCPLCQESDREEAALLARVRDAELIDLGALAIAASRPWREGEPERAA